MSTFFSSQPSPAPLELEELRFGRWRIFAISGWSALAIATLLITEFCVDADILLDGEQADTKLWSMTLPNDMDFVVAKTMFGLGAYFSLALFIVALIYALKALCIPTALKH